MEEIRILTENEMPDSAELIHFAFKSSNRADDPLVKCLPEDTWGYFIDGQLAANIVILPLQAFVNGYVHEMGMIAGVASWPEYRKGGTVRQLMIRGLQAMKDKGQTISYLGPFSYSFYRRFGWEMMYEYKKYTLKANCVPDWRGSGSVSRIRPDLPRLNDIYVRYAAKYNGMANRSVERWNSSILANKKGMIAVYCNEAGEDRGYLIYEYRGVQLTIHEFVYLDRDANKGLWEFIRKQDSMYESVTFKAPADDRFPFLIDNPKGLEISFPAHLMARIIDVPGFLAKCRFKENGGGTAIGLTVTDEYAPWNNGTYRLSIGEDGAVEVRPTVAGVSADGSLPHLACDIQTMSTLMIGYQKPSFLHEIGRLQGSVEAVRVLEERLPGHTPYYLDFGY
ncbi:enhanced intracellular survival protein Eis [Paenibacillus sp. HJGM_3]|uniref:GNAT family N-acetyltransferase n=1 Tax=Paenibacillus sp. HJGM_3 TaxID=3379816 RepID=UPI00385C7E48